MATIRVIMIPGIGRDRDALRLATRQKEFSFGVQRADAGRHPSPLLVHGEAALHGALGEQPEIRDHKMKTAVKTKAKETNIQASFCYRQTFFSSQISHFSSGSVQLFSELEKPALFFRSPAIFFRFILSFLARSDPPPNPQPHPKIVFFNAGRPGSGLGMGLPKQQQISEVIRLITTISEPLTTNFRSHNNIFQSH
jgi:hypothetical protein